MSAALEHFVAEGWNAVSLAEVDRRAALLDRQESKYVLPVGRLAHAGEALREQFDVLAIDGRRVFGYDTIYFDTGDLQSYRQHAQGRRLRFKARTRRYLDSNLCFAEIKLKGTRDRTIKHRVRLDASEHGASSDVASFFAGAVRATYGAVELPVLQPTLRMRFERVTLVGTEAPERVTIDHRMRFVADSGEPAAASDGVVIVEVKSPNGHGVADRILRAAGSRGERCSKYCIGLNLVRPGLRNNAFKRPLQRYFAPGP